MTNQARKSPPARVGFGERLNKVSSRSNCSTQQPVETLLARLEGVQQTGQGWRAKCPSCGGRSRKVAISEGHDGRVLMHCFAGCASAEVLAAVGLQLADMFPRRDLRTMSRAERSAMRQAAQIPRWRAALEALAIEGRVVQIAAGYVVAGIELDDEQVERLDLAANRISEAREVLNAR